MDIDPTTFANFIFCIIILALGITAYFKMKRVWPLFIGIAFGLFGVSHLFTILDLKETLEGVLLAARIVAYLLVLVSVYWYGCRKYAKP
jgi:uncharacterized membrane protein (UPF0136 family)